MIPRIPALAARVATPMASASALATYGCLYSTGPSYNQYVQQQPQQPRQLNSTQPFPQYFPPQQQPPKKSGFHIRKSTYVFLLFSTALGAYVAYFINIKRHGLLSPEDVRGSPEEREAKDEFAVEADATIPLVRQLQQDPAWDEWDVGQRWREIEAKEAAEAADTAANTDAASKVDGAEVVDVADVSADVTPIHKMSLSGELTGRGAIPPPTPQRTRLTTGALGGIRGMGAYHRIFHNRETGQIISIMHMGSSLAGWPRVVHGGAIATILDEALGRCAILSFPARTGVTARLELQYRSPVRTDDFYVVTCTPLIPDEYKNNKEGVDSNGKELRKLWCEATLDTVEGKRCVEARGLFVVPRKYKLGKVEDKF
ncbi:hypothetical protein Sste5346_008151 [Sporothrix stenoceras]|uniref:Thioesterase domain-containing protein n=1 Tax=Sporothrix stenoceras TaxID=5173 RepID=A0ABR3YQM3_9PEZI